MQVGNSMSYSKSRAICGKVLHNMDWNPINAERKAVRMVMEHQRNCIKCQRKMKLNAIKKGDKLLCKKSISKEDLAWFFDIGITKGFEEYKYYEIMDIDKDWYVDSISVSMMKHKFEFHIGLDTYKMMLWDYFYIPQELRKIKLEKLERLDISTRFDKNDTVIYNRQ